MATSTKRRKRQPKPPTVHPAGSAEAVSDVRYFVVQEQRLRDRRAELREAERRAAVVTKRAG
jgi:hypothetical protein